MIRSRIICSLLPLLTLTACNTSPIEPGEVKAKWTRNFHQLGIVPIFPPREDVYVGDIYLYENDPDDEKYLDQMFRDYNKLTKVEKIDLIRQGMGSRLSRVNFNDLLSSEYHQTISAPKTSSDLDSILANPTVAELDNKISQQKVKITEVEITISDLNKSNAAAEDRLTRAIRTKEDIDKEVSRHKANLDNLKSKNPEKVDTSDLKSQLKEAKLEQRRKEDELAKIEYDKQLVESGSDEEKKLLQEEKTRTYELRKLTKKSERLQEDIDNAPTVPVNYSNEQILYDTTVKKQQAAEDEVTTATRFKADTIAKNTASLANEGTKLTKEKEKLEELNNLKKTIVSVGARTLYKQPNTDSNNLFDWTSVDASKDASRTNRLKLVAFPEFSSTIVSQHDLSALIPAEALKFNLSSSSVDKISLKIPFAESYGISFTILADKLFSLDSGEFVFSNELSSLTKSLMLLQHLSENDEVYLRIISEVYYARAFDVNIFSSDSFGLVANYAKAPENSSDDVSETVNGESKEDDYSYFNGVINSSASGDSDDHLTTLRSNLNRSQNVPGGTVQTLSYSDRSIGIRRVFDRPIAVGYRAITLKVILCTEEQQKVNSCRIRISDIKVSDSPTPAIKG